MELSFHPSLMHLKATAESSDLEKATDRCIQDIHALNSGRDRERARSSKKDWRYCLLLSACCPLSLRIAGKAYDALAASVAGLVLLTFLDRRYFEATTLNDCGRKADGEINIQSSPSARLSLSLSQ
jgi:hypothetical protein